MDEQTPRPHESNESLNSDLNKTRGFILTKDQMKTLFVHQEIPSEISDSVSTHFLAVYYVGDKLSRITTYPIKLNHFAWKLSIIVSDISPEIIGQINTINEHELIHTTGISKTGTNFYMELYFSMDPATYKISEIKTDLRNRFSEMDEISSYSIKQI